MHVGPKIAQICDFVYKSNANWDFRSNSYNWLFLLLMIEFNLFWLDNAWESGCNKFQRKNNKKQKVEKNRNT